MSNKPRPLVIVCDDITIANIHDTIRPTELLSSIKPGDMLAVRPCAEKYNKKTVLGMYLCSAPTSVHAVNKEGKTELRMSDYTNPAIYIPSTGEIVWGYSSWWGEIKSADELKQITDEDISNVWYVKALNQLAELEKKQ